MGQTVRAKCEWMKLFVNAYQRRGQILELMIIQDMIPITTMKAVKDFKKISTQVYPT